MRRQAPIRGRRYDGMKAYIALRRRNLAEALLHLWLGMPRIRGARSTSGISYVYPRVGYYKQASLTSLGEVEEQLESETLPHRAPSSLQIARLAAIHARTPRPAWCPRHPKSWTKALSSETLRKPKQEPLVGGS